MFGIATQGRAWSSRRGVSMLWRAFAANAVVFVVAVGLLALTPVTIHARIRLVELVVLLVGLVAMLAIDLLLLRQTLGPLGRLSRVMAVVDPLRPGQRATGFEHAGSEVHALAHAFNQMLERLEDERRHSATQALAAQEAERRRIARELHDQIGQTLIAVALRAEHAASKRSEESAEFARLAQIVQHTLADVRRISRELRPEALEELGLVNALIALCSQVSERTGLRVARRLEGGLPSMDPEVELAIYRIAQEALTNVVRHASASEVTVSLSHGGDELVLSVSDDGRGLPERLAPRGGMTGMHERALLVGGELRVESGTSTGASVTLRVALDDR